jgi:fructose-specific component phosphotransferase system IIB-like protein
MALPTNRPNNIVCVSAYMADSSTASSVYLPAPCKGYVKKVFIALQGTAVTSADNTFTAAIAKSTDFTSFTAITMDALVQAASGSTAGDGDSAATSSANWVDEGDTIRVTSDGAGSSTCPTMVTVLIEAH